MLLKVGIQQTLIFNNFSLSAGKPTNSVLQAQKTNSIVIINPVRMYAKKNYSIDILILRQQLSIFHECHVNSFDIQLSVTFINIYIYYIHLWLLSK